MKRPSRRRRVDRVVSDLDRKINAVLEEEPLGEYGFDLVVIAHIGTDRESTMFIGSNLPEEEWSRAKYMVEEARKVLKRQ